MFATRRALLRATTFAAPAILLGCTAAQEQQVQTVSAEAVAYVQAIGPALQGELAVLQASVGLNTARAQTITGLVARIATLAGGFVGTLAQNAGQSVVSQIGSAFTALQAAVNASGVILPPDVQLVMTAVQVSLPFIEGLLGMALAAADRPQTNLTPAKALEILQAAAAT